MKECIMKAVLLAVVGLAVAGCQTTGMSSITNGPARVLYPVEECGMVKVPVYGVVDRPASGGEVLSGAVIGGVIGNTFGKGSGNDAMTVLGAIIGGSTANQRKQERVIIRYDEKHQCRTVYK